MWTAVGGGTTQLADSYRLIDEDTIVVESVSGSATWTRVTDVRESTDAVRITIKSLSAPVPHTAVGVPIEFVIDLAQPLGDRVVLDGFWNVPLRP